jgi:hypothetical protein
MTRNAFLVAGALALTLASGAATARDFGYGGRYSAHLSSYDGRALGPPVSAFGPVYDDGDPRSIYAPRYDYIHGQLVVTTPVITHPKRYRRVYP